MGKNSNKFYQCKKCKMFYKEKKWADKCEEWCKEKHSCNLEITKHAFKEDEI